MYSLFHKLIYCLFISRGFLSLALSSTCLVTFSYSLDSPSDKIVDRSCIVNQRENTDNQSEFLYLSKTKQC